MFYVIQRPVVNFFFGTMEMEKIEKESKRERERERESKYVSVCESLCVSVCVSVCVRVCLCVCVSVCVKEERVFGMTIPRTLNRTEKNTYCESGYIYFILPFPKKHWSNYYPFSIQLYFQFLQIVKLSSYFLFRGILTFNFTH